MPVCPSRKYRLLSGSRHYSRTPIADCFHPCPSKDITRRPVKGKRPAVSQVCQIDHSTLKPSSLPSVRANYRKLAVRQGVKVPSLDIFGAKCFHGRDSRQPALRSRRNEGATTAHSKVVFRSSTICIVLALFCCKFCERGSSGRQCRSGVTPFMVLCCCQAWH